MRLFHFAVFTTAALASACDETHRPSTPCGHTEFSRALEPNEQVDDVDVLFVIDDTEGMSSAQERLVLELPRMVQVLTTGEREDDAGRDFEPANSLHIGVISTDMGAGDQADVPTCNLGPGGDGILRRTSNGVSPCAPEYPSGTFEFMRGEDSAAFVVSPACVALLGTNGCAYSQPMEAALKALTPATPQIWTAPGYATPAFANGALPHGLAANVGFLRPDSALAIVFLTHADDASLLDYSLMGAAFADVPQPLRASSHAQTVHLVSRYVDGFRGLRRNPTRLIFGALIGIPREAEPAAAMGDFGVVLAHPDMAPRINETATDLAPSCTGRGVSASPPVRLVETAGTLASQGVSSTLSSICAPSYTPAFDALIDEIANVIDARCAPRPYGPEPTDFSALDCEVHEVLPPVGTPGAVSECAALPGRTFLRNETFPSESRQVCRVTRIRPDEAETRAGWYFAPQDAECFGAVVTFTHPAIGTEVRRSCLQTLPYTEVPPSTHCNASATSCELGQRCAFERDECSRGSAAGAPLTCDPVAQICTVGCSGDADCDAAGLVGFICDTSTIEDAQAGYMLPSGVDVSQPRNVCINPSC